MTDSSICDNPLLNTPLPENEVVIMEDKKDTQKSIRDILENQYNLNVKIAKDKYEVINFAEDQKHQVYLLDVHMGDDRRQEGIDALEVIKELNADSFVSILTGHPTPEIKKMAYKFGVDLYKEKTVDLEKDIREIALKIKKYNYNLLKERLEIVDKCRNEILSKLEKLGDSPSYSQFSEDSNITTYKKLKLDQDWLAKYQGKYVAFINGELIDSNEDEQKLIEKLKTLKKQDKPIFFTKVEENQRIIDLPSSLCFD